MDKLAEIRRNNWFPEFRSPYWWNRQNGPKRSREFLNRLEKAKEKKLKLKVYVKPKSQTVKQDIDVSHLVAQLNDT